MMPTKESLWWSSSNTLGLVCCSCSGWCSWGGGAWCLIGHHRGAAHDAAEGLLLHKEGVLIPTGRGGGDQEECAHQEGDDGCLSAYIDDGVPSEAASVLHQNSAHHKHAQQLSPSAAGSKGWNKSAATSIYPPGGLLRRVCMARSAISRAMAAPGPPTAPQELKVNLESSLRSGGGN